MICGATISFGVCGSGEKHPLDHLIQVCRYLGFPEVAPEAADVVLTDEPPAVSYGQVQPWLSWQDLTVFRRDDCLTFTYGAWRVVIDVARRRVTPLALPPDADPSTSYACHSYLRLVLLFLLRRLGWFELHGGACVHDGRGYVFVGPSGGGKTSAVLGLLNAGWRYVADDALLIKRLPANGADDAVCVRAGREWFSITTDGLRRFPHLRPYAEPRLQGVAKWLLNPHVVWPDRYEPVMKPAFLFFCRLDDAERTQVRPLPAKDALARLMTGTPWLALDRETAAAHLATYRRLAESCHSFTLLAGRDLLRRPSALADHLDPSRLLRLHHTYA